jgi:hypothetical protein
MPLTLSERLEYLSDVIDRQAAISFILRPATPLAITSIEAVSPGSWSSKDTLNVPVACERKERMNMEPLRGNE